MHLHTGGTSSLGELLLAFAESFANFGEVAAQRKWQGWTRDTVGVPCIWTGVVCSGGLVNITLNAGLTGQRCTALLCSGHVNLPSPSPSEVDPGPAGTIDSSWAALGPYLLSLNLDGNPLSGELDPSWAKLWPHLTFLDLSFTGLHSELPPEWGQLGAFPSLQVLRLERNINLTGEVPSELCPLDRRDFPPSPIRTLA